MYVDYKNSNVPDLHLDLDVLDPRQYKAVETAKEFIMKNAADPKSYKPLKFANLGQDKIYKMEEKFDLDTIKEELKNSNIEMFDRLMQSKGKQLNKQQFSLLHTYELKDKNGVMHRCLSSISFDSTLRVINIDNKEDFVVKFWNERNSKWENWEALFKK